MPGSPLTQGHAQVRVTPVAVHWRQWRFKNRQIRLQRTSSSSRWPGSVRHRSQAPLTAAPRRQ